MTETIPQAPVDLTAENAELRQRLSALEEKEEARLRPVSEEERYLQQVAEIATWPWDDPRRSVQIGPPFIPGGNSTRDDIHRPHGLEAPTILKPRLVLRTFHERNGRIQRVVPESNGGPPDELAGERYVSGPCACV